MTAYLPPKKTFGYKVFDALERRFARTVFVKFFLQGDNEMARTIGVPIGFKEYAVSAMIAPMIALRMAAYRLALSTPGLRQVTDRHLVRRIRKLLTRYGHAEFTTDAEAYRPAHAASGSA